MTQLSSLISGARAALDPQQMFCDIHAVFKQASLPTEMVARRGRCRQICRLLLNILHQSTIYETPLCAARLLT